MTEEKKTTNENGQPIEPEPKEPPKLVMFVVAWVFYSVLFLVMSMGFTCEVGERVSGSLMLGFLTTIFVLKDK